MPRRPDDSPGDDTGRPGASPSAPGPLLLAAICVLVVVFRIGAWLDPSRAVTVAPALALPLAVLGLLFLGCGAWAWLTRPSPLTRVFLAYCAGAAIHWGGAAGAPNATLEVLLLTLYAAATAIGDGAFLDLSLRYPSRSNVSGLGARAPYLPGAVALLSVPVAPFLPEPALAALLQLAFLLAFAMSISAGVVLLAKWGRASREERRRARLSPIAAALVVSTVLDLLGESGLLPGEPDAWKLAYGLVPPALARALAGAPPATGALSGRSETAAGSSTRGERGPPESAARRT